MRYAMVPLVVAFAAFFAVAPSGGADRTVEIVPAPGGFRYEPSTLTAQPGDRVAFVNRTGSTHTASCTGCPWTTGDIQPEQRKHVTFRYVRRYEFACRYHPDQLRGDATVGSVPSPASPSPSPSPSPSF